MVKAELQRTRDFLEAFTTGFRLALDTAAADEADPPAIETWTKALEKLRPFAHLLPPMLVSPLQLGGVSCEWHELGINLELRFRGLTDIFAVIEDARSELTEYYGPDAELLHAGEALAVLAQRMV